MRKRVLVLCLDAFDAAFADRLMAAGKLPGLARLKADSARFQLEHGSGGKARYTGLTWEHFSSGRMPETSGKWSVISFDPKTYGTRQSHATERPFLADTDAKCVVFDVPYFHLQSMTNAIGVVGWGGHDVGTRRQSMPARLLGEIGARFGAPPDAETLNVMVYPSAERTTRMAEFLRASVKRRTDIAEWLLMERAPDWEVALIGYGESHDSIELFYHGIDDGHHLSGLPSAEPARRGLIGVYEEISTQIERLTQRFPDAAVVAFTMHGMGANDTDLPTMLLLPELMYRMSFGRPLFVSRDDWRSAQAPALRDGEDWNAVINGAMMHERRAPLGGLPTRAVRWTRRMAIRTARAVLGQGLTNELLSRRAAVGDKSFDVDWMPAAQYARYWTQMDAFAVPSYFEGRVRVNLAGRERNGRVPLERYGAWLDRIEAALRACVDIKTGAPVVKEIIRPNLNDPTRLPDTQGDLAILWNGSPLGFRHPDYGEIGPGPVRRTGGHSGGFGALYVRGAGMAPGDYGLRSSFDVAPTVVDLVGAACRARIDGKSVLRATTGADRSPATGASATRPGLAAFSYAKLTS